MSTIIVIIISSEKGVRIVLLGRDLSFYIGIKGDRTLN